MQEAVAVTVQNAFDRLDPADFVPPSYSEHTPGVRGDGAILTARAPSGLVLSAISNRALLREVVTRLMPLGGRRVFEIGSGTGYLACVLARLAGPDGFVEGCEIIPELARTAQRNPAVTASPNLRLHEGDFVEVLSRLGTFDVVLGTSSFSVLHAAIPRACAPDGGTIALPVEIPGGGDCLTVFRRQGSRLQATEAMLSLSVPTTGLYSGRHIWAPPVDEAIPGWEGAAKTVVSLPGGARRPIHDTVAFRSWLLFHEPRFAAVNLGDGHLSHAGDMAFGLVSPDAGSACLQHGDTLVLHGPGALELAGAYTARRTEWQREGSPSLADYRYAIDLSAHAEFPFTPAMKDRVAVCK